MTAAEKRRSECRRWLADRSATDRAPEPDRARMWAIRILNDVADVHRMRLSEAQQAAATMMALADEVERLRKVGQRHKAEIAKLCEANRRRNAGVTE